ncbi:hypothetical protein D3C72_1886590 [compost metagenome]
MHMRLDQPFELELVLLDIGDDLVGAVIGDAAGGIVDVHDAVDDSAGVGIGVLNHIADRIGGGVEERRNLGVN